LGEGAFEEGAVVVPFSFFVDAVGSFESMSIASGCWGGR
jgi:hypothetical protein